jgi:O-antigen/teichoic acid export membrane protein
MSFRTLAMIENVAFVGANLVGIAMAIAGFGVWSLVALTLATGVIKVGLLWLASDWHPTGPPDRGSIRDLWGFSSRLAGFTAVNYWARNADNLLIGRFIGTNQLAYYNRAYNLMSLPLDIVSSVATRVMYPALSHLQGDRFQVKRIYLRALGLIAIVMFPAIVGLAVLSTPFIVSVYGAKWEPSAPLLQILCVAGLLQTLARTSGWIFQSQGRTDWLFRWGVVATTTVVCAFFIGLPWGTTGVAVAYSCWTVLAMPVLFSISGRLIGATVVDMARSVSGVSLAALVMGIVTWFANDRLPSAWSPFVHLVVGIGVGSITYTVALHLISPAPYHECRQLLDQYRSRILRPSRAT